MFGRSDTVMGNAILDNCLGMGISRRFCVYLYFRGTVPLLAVVPLGISPFLFLVLLATGGQKVLEVMARHLYFVVISLITRAILQLLGGG
jgi:hypothetical protein